MESGRYPTFLKHRPGSQPKGTLHEDHGSGLNVPAPDADSDDELNSLPPRSSQAPSSPTKPKSRPDTEDVIKNMHFKKRKPGTVPDAPTSKENTRRAADTAKKLEVPALAKKRNVGAAASSSSTRPLSDNSSRRNSSPDAHARHNATSQAPRYAQGTNTRESKPERSMRPMPPLKTKSGVPRTASSSSVLVVEDNSQPRRPRSFPPMSPLKNPEKTSERPWKAKFPSLSPVGESKGKGKEVDRTVSGDRKEQGKRREKDKKPMAQPYPMAGISPVREKANFPPSPSGTPDRGGNELTAFPDLSPLRSESAVVEKKKKKKKQKQPAPEPFPMGTHDFSHSPGKRRSIGSDLDDERDSKRSRTDVSAGVAHYVEEDSLLFISPTTDPTTLCPYCDTPLPAEPTPLLARLLEQTFRKSYRDPRPANPLGRKAPMNIFVAVCQRHQFESKTLPKAEACGWPKSIDWSGLKGRVLNLEEDLRRILSDRGDPIAITNESNEGQKEIGGSQGKKGPRMRCLFWKDLLKELKTKGTKGVKGVQGQFATFDKTQPGYYGELGSVIIHQTLYDMFPLVTIDPILVDPLTPNEFIQRILVPEVGMRLVIQDLNLDVNSREDKREAVEVLRESASYGVAMFPADGEDWAGSGSGARQSANGGGDEGIAEQMMMERARKRRLELEVEEREEDEMWRLQEEEAEKQREGAAAAKPKGKGTARKEKEKEEVMETTAPRPRPRPIPRNKRKALATSDSTSGMETDSCPDPRRSSDSDLDLPVQSRAFQMEWDTAPTPKPSRSRTCRLESTSRESDSDVEVASPVQSPKRKARSTKAVSVSSKFGKSEANIPVQPLKRKTRSTRAASATSRSRRSELESEDVVITKKSRSPSVTVTSSKSSVPHSSVIDVCSSSDDGGSVVAVVGPSKPRKEQQPVVRKARKQQLPDSSEDADDEQATPRPAKAKTIDNGVAPSGLPKDFRPLDVARRRLAATKVEHAARPGNGQKISAKWFTSMAVDIDSEEDEKPEEPAWLLEDVQLDI